MSRPGDFLIVGLVCTSFGAVLGGSFVSNGAVDPVSTVSLPPTAPPVPSAMPISSAAPSVEKPGWRPPKDFYLDSFKSFQGTWVGKNDRMLVYNEEWIPQKQRYAGYLKINEDEVYCGFEGKLPTGNRTGQPTEFLNNQLDPLDGVWWTGHCTGTRFPPGPPSVLRVTAYWRWPAIYTEHDFYVVIGEMQYGPFRREYPAD